MRVNVRPPTLRRDHSMYRCHLGPVFGKTPIDQIGFRQAQRFVAELVATGLAPRTVHKAAGLLSQPLDAAVRSGLLTQNPVRGLALPQPPHVEPRFLDPGEVERLAAAIAPPLVTKGRRPSPCNGRPTLVALDGDHTHHRGRDDHAVPGFRRRDHRPPRLRAKQPRATPPARQLPSEDQHTCRRLRRVPPRRARGAARQPGRHVRLDDRGRRDPDPNPSGHSPSTTPSVLLSATAGGSVAVVPCASIRSV